MKHKLFSFLTVILLLVATNLQAQNHQKSIDHLKQQTNAVVKQNSQTGIAEFVRFPVDDGLQLRGNSPKQKSVAFLQDYKGIFGIESISDHLIFKETKTDNYGLKYAIYNQMYRGVPVFDGQLRFHFDANENLSSINGNFIPGISKLNSFPTLNVQQANSKALELINGQDLNFSGAEIMVISNKLYVFPKGLIQNTITASYLVYEVEVSNSADVREFLYINAHTGELVEQFTGIAHAVNRKVYENNLGNLVWQEGDPFPGTLTIWQRNEVVVTGHVYNFFNNAFSYASFNGAEAQMRVINNNSNLNCPNASWNGSTANFCNGTASDDVIGHEWAHAYTSYTSGLIYAFQAGAINEAYSDIWGETIDLLNFYEDAGENLSVRTSPSCASSRWKIGEDATAFGNPIRDLWNPNCNGDPGKVTDGQYACGENDSGGVHTNSGIPNHCYALLVDGGTYNGFTIAGIGFTKAAHIFWRAQSVYLTPTSDFSDLADALESSAMDLMGINLEGLSTQNVPIGSSGQMISPADLQSVLNAIFAVEMRINPDACGYMPILADTPTLCEAFTTNPMFFENWESGIGNWTVTQLPENPTTWIPREWIISSDLPEDRTGNAIFGPDPINGNCTTSLQNGIIRLESPVITLPDNLDGQYELAFNHYVSTENLWDGGNLKYSVDGVNWLLIPNTAFIANGYNDVLNPINENDNPMHGQAAFTGADGGSLTGSWGQSVIDLSAIGIGANTSFQIRWELGTDGCNGRDGWYLDEVVVYNCAYPLSVADENYLEAGVRVFPNPSDGLYTLKKVRDINLQSAEIFDINGRKIINFDLSNLNNEMLIDISNFAAGVYFMQVNAEDAKRVIKLLKH